MQFCPHLCSCSVTGLEGRVACCSKESEDRPINGTVSYFDLEKDTWRSIKVDAVQEEVVDFSYGASL